MYNSLPSLRFVLYQALVISKFDAMGKNTEQLITSLQLGTL